MTWFKGYSEFAVNGSRSPLEWWKQMCACVLVRLFHGAYSMTHAHFPICVPAATHCVSQHPSDICRLLFHPAPLSHCPDDITGSAAAREVNLRGRELVMISRTLLHFCDAQMNADERITLLYLQHPLRRDMEPFSCLYTPSPFHWQRANIGLEIIGKK